MKTAIFALFAVIGIVVLSACGGGGGGGGGGSSAVPPIETPQQQVVRYTESEADLLRSRGYTQAQAGGGLITITITPSDFTALVEALAAERAKDSQVVTVQETLTQCFDGSVAAAGATCPEPPPLAIACTDGSTAVLPATCPPPIEAPDFLDPVACAEACPGQLSTRSTPSRSLTGGGIRYDLNFDGGGLPSRSVGTRRTGTVYRIITSIIGCCTIHRGTGIRWHYREEGINVLSDDDYLHWGVWGRDDVPDAAFALGAPLASDYQLPKGGGATYQGKVEFGLGGDGSQTGRIRMIAAFDSNDTVMEGFLIQAQNQFQLNLGVSTYRNGQFENGLVTCGSIGTCTGTPTNNRWSAAFFGTAADNGAPTKLGGVFEAQGFDNLGGVLNADIVGAFGAELQ